MMSASINDNDSCFTIVSDCVVINLMAINWIGNEIVWCCWIIICVRKGCGFFFVNRKALKSH